MIPNSNGSRDWIPTPSLKGEHVNALSLDLRAALYYVFGTDPTQIHGFGSTGAELVAERGTDLAGMAERKPL